MTGLRDPRNDEPEVVDFGVDDELDEPDDTSEEV